MAFSFVDILVSQHNHKRIQQDVKMDPPGPEDSTDPLEEQELDHCRSADRPSRDRGRLAA